MKSVIAVIASLLLLSFLGNVIMINKYRVRGDEMNTERLEAEELRAEKAAMTKEMEKYIAQINIMEAEYKKLLQATQKPAKKK